MIAVNIGYIWLYS